MTTDRALIEFNAAAYLLYARQEHTMSTIKYFTYQVRTPLHIYAHETKQDAIDRAQSLRDAGATQVHILHVQNGQGCAISTHDWNPFPEFPCTCPDCTGDTCPCGAPIPDEGDYCHDCAQDHVPEEAAAMKTYTGFNAYLKYIVGGLALALSLTTHTASAADTLTYESQHGRGTLTLPYIGTPAYSDSCTITQAWEDHSAVAYCTEDGATYHFDPDGMSRMLSDGTIVQTSPPGWYAD